MSGFSFSLKTNKVTKDKKVKPGLTRRTVPKKNALFHDEDATTDKKTSIDAFDSSKGAMLGSTAVSETPVLIIEPVNRTHRLRRPSISAYTGDDSENADTSKLLAEEKARISLLKGELYQETSSKVIASHSEDGDAEAAPEDYEAVPVDQFGAALLRGMGWSGEPEPNNQAGQDVSHRKQGAVLGIGAKSIDKDLEAELLSKKNLGVPLIKRER
ncbi:hypothetical protein METBIDRAFT_45677 [Metschnikowia bicuspidata var. bicuspidata NRRL YB-4993]|uniref:Pre-mRNA-splicing factor n=1 Tax=Metschnikowia bicuspidata var. bicuspidata NRRL YB-4993 TaxID=869754 RepID=A0A1A0H5U0_9ASCO|nr:hypothetical protein METBIDRAFT_45677 [Metschnikowia bicuspidata var. bicuspidata NRRL YB-4993]OBA19454.1 hypothetical protein METBIDRAFT_45677 [Metschnikowia bicuspidata var. bicuspidata NRRL YB-4993]